MQKLKNPKGDHLSWAVHMSGMSQFVHSKYQTTCAVLVEIRDAQMSNDQSERRCPCNVHTQLWPSWGCSWAEGARPVCGSTCKYMDLSLCSHIPLSVGPAQPYTSICMGCLPLARLLIRSIETSQKEMKAYSLTPSFRCYGKGLKFCLLNFCT